MATYEMSIMEYLPKLYPGDKITCAHTGDYKVLTLPRGRYRLECYGAQGFPLDSSAYGAGGKGGYSVGTLVLNSGANLYLYVGGAGRDDGEGGFNGGGDGGSNGGGGATDIRVNGTSLYRRILVAGGGGGRGEYAPREDMKDWSGGTGGGLKGTPGKSTQCAGKGGTQTSGGLKGVGTSSSGLDGSFGFGGTGGKGSIHAAAGGGGGWYGGGGGGYTTGLTTLDIYGGSGGGGSGYVFTKDTAKDYPEGCLVDERYYLRDTAMGTGTNPGHGFIVVTILELVRIDTVKLRKDGVLLNLEEAYIKVGGEWKEVDSAHVKQSNRWKTLI